MRTGKLRRVHIGLVLLGVACFSAGRRWARRWPRRAPGPGTPVPLPSLHLDQSEDTLTMGASSCSPVLPSTYRLVPNLEPWPWP